MVLNEDGDPPVIGHGPRGVETERDGLDHATPNTAGEDVSREDTTTIQTNLKGGDTG